MIREARGKFYESIFIDFKEPSRIWKKPGHLGLIRQRAASRRLVFNVKQLNRFFAAPTEIITSPLSMMYLGEEIYDDSKFYWGDIKPSDIVEAMV